MTANVKILKYKMVAFSHVWYVHAFTYLKMQDKNVSWIWKFLLLFANLQYVGNRKLQPQNIYFSNLPVALMIITRLLCSLICSWTLTPAYCLIGISHLCSFTTAWIIFHHLYQQCPYSFRSNLNESFTAFSQRSSFFFTLDIFCAVTFSPNYR